LRTTTVFVTHDQNGSDALADHVVVMNKGDVLQADTPHGVYNFPRACSSPVFIGRPAMNFVPLDTAGRTWHVEVQVGAAAITVPRTIDGSAHANARRAAGAHPA